MKPITKILNERDKILFEKAMKFYFYSRQQDVRNLNSNLQERLQYSGQVAYSLIVTFIKEGKLRIEYMDFLNDEIKTMRGLDPSFFKNLLIKPHQIDEIELSRDLSIKVFDEDVKQDLEISYQPEAGTVIMKAISKS